VGDYRLAGDGVDLVDDVVAVLAAHEEAAHGPRIADVELRSATFVLRRRESGQVGPMALARVDDEEARGAAGLEHALGRRQGLEQERGVVAERLAETAGVHEVALEVDHDQRGRLRIELELSRFRLRWAQV